MPWRNEKCAPSGLDPSNSVTSFWKIRVLLMEKNKRRLQGSHRPQCGVLSISTEIRLRERSLCWQMMREGSIKLEYCFKCQQWMSIFTKDHLLDTLTCYEGADCLQTDSCDECSGVGCMRLKSYSTEHLHTIALTCLPYATRLGAFVPELITIFLWAHSNKTVNFKLVVMMPWSVVLIFRLTIMLHDLGVPSIVNWC